MLRAGRRVGHHTDIQLLERLTGAAAIVEPGGAAGAAIVEALAEARVLAAELERYRTVIEALHEAVVLQDADGAIVACNRRAEELLGLTVAELEGRTSADPLWEAVHPDGTPWPGEDHPPARVLATGAPQIGELMGVRSGGGALRWVRLNAVPLRGAGDELSGVAVTFVDVTDRRVEQERLQRATELFGTAFVAAPIGIALVALDGSWLRINPRLCEILGYTEDDLLRRTFQDVTHPDDLDADLALLEDTLAGRRHGYQLIKRYVRSDGSVIWAQLSVALVCDADERPLHFVSHVDDVTERRELEQRLTLLADRDSLTGLLNRRRFEDEMLRQLARCRRHGERAVLAMIDLDGFKAVNDTHGHAAGDTVLRAIGPALAARVRATETAARLGGDEFAVILLDVDDEGAAAAAAGLSEAIERAAGHDITASVGLAPLRPDDTIDAALARADRAMYVVKRARAAG
jgi:diguanylate cyclase (GGDEF)-like protein/PAS domain S-box-containing protein